MTTPRAARRALSVLPALLALVASGIAVAPSDGLRVVLAVASALLAVACGAALATSRAGGGPGAPARPEPARPEPSGPASDLASLDALEPLRTRDER
jgi:hypothetical protein